MYQITCANCPTSYMSYVGETRRPLAKRLKAHQLHSSPVSAHLAENNHSYTNMTKEDVVVRLNLSTLLQNARRWTDIEAITPSPWSTDSCCHMTLVTRTITGSHMIMTRKPQFSEEDPRTVGWVKRSNFTRCSLVLTWTYLHASINAIKRWHK